MAISDFVCPSCDTVHFNIYVTLAEFDNFVELCSVCETPMDYDLRRKGSRRTRSHKFQEFTLDHTVRVTGEKKQINSMADIRRLEREHKDIDLCVEAFSYDGERGNEDPVSEAEPVVMSEQQKRDFAERFRDMNIKDERSARDYE